ncbi:BspA family leucine-rich repeat surface protein [Ruminococcus sp.]|uniref:BspA family leucine-rich repeat surface protein n=1 Tax=Ruminococcus sp. TaxID=41978 RepID=UPI002585714B|nr:BspA family leucine-rich repeat surface protein [Ruminococcus sp.]MCR5021420.1 BspA family leucine-rich repeat surface protein [Ruminococcus sp.]
MQRKRILAAVMSLCMVAGAASYGAPVISQTITAQAEAATEAECYSFDEETGVLTLRGEIDGDALREFNSINREKVNSVVAEEGTILPEDSSELFYRYINCNSIDLSNADTSKVTNMSYMFNSCYDLTSLDLSKFDTSKVTRMVGMFNSCNNLTEIDVSGFDTSKVTDMSHLFDGCNNLTEIDVSGFDTSKVTYMIGMFNSCNNLTALDVSGFDTSNVTGMHCMFDGCKKLQSLDVSGFDTSNVTNMIFMFSDCSDLTSLDLSGFDTSNVTNMTGMFEFCNNLTELDVSGFDTSNVTDMSGMFEHCFNLTELDVSGFDTSNVTDMGEMFENCVNLISLDVSSFNTSKVTDMNCMFHSCKKLTSLDLSGFDTRKLIKLDIIDPDIDDTYSDMDRMFYGCYNLRKITLGENFKCIKFEADLNEGAGWVNVDSPSVIVSGGAVNAVIENNGINTYVLYFKNAPVSIKTEYSEKYHQMRFTWNKVENADRYGIAVYLAGKWRVQAQDITDTTYTTPKNLTPGKTYKVAVAARVDGKWYTSDAIKNAVTVTIK